MKVEPFIFRALGDQETIDPNAVNATNIPLNDNTDIEEEIVEITYSEEDIIQAKNQGIAEGIIQGKNESTETDKQLIATLSDFSNKIEGFFNTHYNVIAVEKEITTQASIDIANKITLLYPDDSIIDAIKTMVDDVYDTAIRKPEITILVHENLKDNIEEYIGKKFNKDRFSGLMDIRYSSDIPTNDFSVKWNDGGIQRDTEKIWLEIEKIMNHKRLNIKHEKSVDSNDSAITENALPDNAIEEKPQTTETDSEVNEAAGTEENVENEAQTNNQLDNSNIGDKEE